MTNTAVSDTKFVPGSAQPCQPIRRRPAQLGAHLRETGVDFAVQASYANEVWVCLVDPATNTEQHWSLNRDNFGLWSGHIPGIGAGQHYGYRVFGKWEPGAGLRHNPNKLLLDPYTRAIGRSAQLGPELYSHVVDTDLLPAPDFPLDTRDSAALAPLGTVVAPESPLTQPLYLPWNTTVIYEAHVVGLTKQFDRIPAELRGTYAGLAHPETVAYLQNLGITAIELLPIHAKMSEPFLTQQGKANYWGYNTLGFFAPEPSYATAHAQAAGPQAVLTEVKQMVCALHEAGIEVILDVVYNHTCEAGIDGPTVSWRGLDNTSYYRHDSARPGQFKDSTGCGNSLDFRRQSVIRLTLDSLRYWVSEFGIDGFRFDLAVTLSRDGDTFNRHHPLYQAMATDPVLREIKLINEPWDVGFGGWRTGQFPIPTADWNDRFRDTLRSFWLSEPAAITAGGAGEDQRDLATRLSGSADLFSHGRTPGGRSVHASVNMITAHDGFTLADLVSYNEKHNWDNGEENRDGTPNNLSWNHGVEGNPADLPDEVAAARRKSARNLMASLLLAAGTPMITAGDEILKTQNGNNNAYCQDSPLSWLDWPLGPTQQDMYQTTKYLLQLRRENSALRPTSFYTGTAVGADALPDLEWLDRTGNQVPEYLWFDNTERVIQVLRSGAGTDADVLLVLNGSPNAQTIQLPTARNLPFHLVWDSQWERPRPGTRKYEPQAVTTMAPLSMQVYLAYPEQ
ncbi:MAG: glycogen debranching protein GlgX [Trueperella sp.]|nr:glycogen debranching protein GlgX [Trueperella sp.]